MQFLLANTFQDSLAKLQPGEQQAAKIATLELQMNPAHPGLQMHKLDRARDRNFWSARVNDDLRLILHRMDASMVICYVAHHDAAYQWAERRKLTVHPVTGAMQVVNLRETVQEIVVPRYVPEAAPPAQRAPKPLPLLAGASDAELLSYGVPVDWLKPVRGANEDTVLEVVEQLPDEAREAVLLLATGTRPNVPKPVPTPAETPAVPAAGASELTSQQAAAAFAHPDAQRRFRSVANVEELKAALEAPWEKWAIFLHPAQRAIVERDFSGPARVTGSAGTGKTIVALHRAVHLAETHPSSRVLLTTFNEVLVRALEKKLRLLIASRPRLAEQIEVLAFEAVARRLYESNLSPLYGPVRIATPAVIESLILEAMRDGGVATPALGIPERFVIAEWHQVIDAAQLRTWEAYRDHTRAGRRSRLREPQRAALWSIFQRVFAALEARREMTVAEMFVRLADHYREGTAPPFDFAVVDEAQDVSQAELRCFAALGGDRPNALFFAGDTAQRIFQTPFSWKANGVEIRGRSTNLKINYRTSQEIRERADRLLDPEITDGDGNTEQRFGTLSVFNGPAPEIRSFAEEREESSAVGEWIKRQIASGTSPGEIILFVRSEAQLPRRGGRQICGRATPASYGQHGDPSRFSVRLSHEACQGPRISRRRCDGLRRGRAARSGEHRRGLRRNRVARDLHVRAPIAVCCLHSSARRVVGVQRRATVRVRERFKQLITSLATRCFLRHRLFIGLVVSGRLCNTDAAGRLDASSMRPLPCSRTPQDAISKYSEEGDGGE